MCGRFVLTEPNDALARLFRAAPANDLPPVPRYNICPTQPVAAVISHAGQRRMGPMRWGFVPTWYKTPAGGPLLINARAETLAEKPAFRDAARQRRCLVPASGFYEWTVDSEGRRLPWFIRPRKPGIIALAGLWQTWAQGDARAVTCAIVTCPANRTLAKLHHRMPVIVAPEDWGLWLGEAGHGAARLMRQAPDTLLLAHRVDSRVNANSAQGPDLIEPLAGAEGQG